MSLPPDSHWTSTPKEGIRDNSKPIIMSTTPDVCKTPIGSAIPPIPYCIVAYPDDAANYTSSVRFTDQKAMVLRSNTTCCYGDEPGTAKGVKSGTVGDICEPRGHSTTVRAEGSPVIRNGDPFYMNKKNCHGKVYWTESLTTHGNKYPRYAQNAHAGTMTDAMPNIELPKVNPRVLTGLRNATGLGLGATAMEMAQKLAEDAQVANALEKLGLNAANPADVLTARAYVWGKNMAPLVFWDVPFSGPGNEAVARAIANMEAAQPGITGAAAAGDKEAQKKLRNAIRAALEIAAASAASSVRISHPCAALALGIPGSKYRGGAHASTKGPVGDKLDSHHTPAKAASYLHQDLGPAIQMERPDHKRTLSNGSSKVAKTYRNTQKKLIDSGRFMDAITMDVVDVQSKFGDKYNGAIAQMMAYATCLKKHGIIK